MMMVCGMVFRRYCRCRCRCVVFFWLRLQDPSMLLEQ
jgi:hypothetical protein